MRRQFDPHGNISSNPKSLPRDFDPLGERNLLLARQQRNLRHLGEVHADRIVAQLRQRIDEYVFLNTKIIAASIRHVRHLHDVTLLGADVATVPAAVLEKASHHPLTDRGMQKFLEDWKKLGIKKFP